jgi:hypothetical protein
LMNQMRQNQGALHSKLSPIEYVLKKSLRETVSVHDSERVLLLVR